MIIGHLPAGYLVSRALRRYLAHDRETATALMWAGLAGSVAPDFDMFYFLLIDARQHHHHSYVTHFPVVWLALLLAALLWRRGMPQARWSGAAILFAVNSFVHLMLDSVVGDIRWLAPFSDWSFSLLTVPALWQPWWLNFLLHGSFALELALVGGALWLWRQDQWAAQSGSGIPAASSAR